MRGWQRWLVASSVSAVLATGGAFGQGPVAESALDAGSVARVVDALTGLVEREVSASGGDLGSQHLHWVFAFSTGHFALDPIRAQAARETALGMLERSAVRGDFVSAYAFEMDVWPHAGAEASPATLPDEADSARQMAAAMLPLTTQAGSQGGHDTERALVGIAAGVRETAGPVILVFTNRAASLTTDAAVRPLLGEDAVAYQTLLHAWRRAPAVNRSGASFEASYEVERATGERVAITLDVVLLTPAAFVSAPTLAPRSELALGSRQPPAVSPPEGGDTAWPIGRDAAIVVAVLAMAGLGILVVSALRRRAATPVRGGARVVTIQGAQIPLDGLRAGAVVCRVVARGFREDDESVDRSPTIVHDQVPFGDDPLGRIVWQRGGLAWKDAAFHATRWRGRPARSPVALGRRGGSLAIEGTVRERPGMPLRSVLATLDIEMGGPA